MQLRPEAMDPLSLDRRHPPHGFATPPGATTSSYSSRDGAARSAGSVQLPTLSELYDAAVDAFVRPVRAGGMNGADAGPVVSGFEAYEEDIDAYVRAMEADARLHPSPDYMSTTQRDLDPTMRAGLIAWLYDVAKECELAPGAHHRAVSYLDRFLSVKPVARSRLQLLGAAAIFVAAKHEDADATCTLGAASLAEFSDDMFTARQVLDMEVDVLKTLRYELSGPTAHTFLERFTSRRRLLHDDGEEEEEDDEEARLARQLAEMALLDYRCIRFRPSVVAAAAVFVARLTLNPQDPPWNRELRKLTGYMPQELLCCVDVMYKMDVDWDIWYMCTTEMKRVYMDIAKLLPDLKAVRVLYSHKP